MGLLIFPLLLLVTLAPVPGPSERALADFNRFQKAVNSEIMLVDRQGAVRQGVLQSANESQLTMQFGGGDTIFQRDAIASAERMRDSRLDGAIKGAIFGAITGAFATQGTSTRGGATAAFIGAVTIYAGIGYTIDASQTHRQMLYRAAPQPPLKVSLRF